VPLLKYAFTLCKPEGPDHQTTHYTMVR
jgi:hypothetical protein